jgi:hypothetical protein
MQQLKDMFVFTSSREIVEDTLMDRNRHPIKPSTSASSSSSSTNLIGELNKLSLDFIYRWCRNSGRGQADIGFSADPRGRAARGMNNVVAKACYRSKR